MNAIDALRATALSKRAPMTTFYAKMLDSGEPSKKQAKLRPSSFPLCSLSTLARMLGDGRMDWSSYMSDAYTGMGHALHDAMHKWSGRQGSKERLFGEWVCEECGQILPVGLDSKCPDCKTQCLYQELEISWLNVTGHLDCVLVNVDSGAVSIGDYKTATDWAIKKGELEGYKINNVHQLFSYAFMFSERFGDRMDREGWKLDTASLLYVSRNNPHNFKEFAWDGDYAVKMGRKIVFGQLRAWRAARLSLRRRSLDAAWAAKRCQSASHYREKVEPTLYGGCPLADVCALSAESRTRAHFKALARKAGDNVNDM